MVTAGTTRIAAEDFTRSLNKDAPNTVAYWDTALGQASFPLSAALGNGEDGTLVVAASTT